MKKVFLFLAFIAFLLNPSVSSAQTKINIARQPVVSIPNAVTIGGQFSVIVDSFNSSGVAIKKVARLVNAADFAPQADVISNAVVAVTYNVAATGNTAMAGRIVKMTVSGVTTYCVVDKIGNRIDFATPVDLSAYLTSAAAATTYATKTTLNDSTAAVRTYANQRATNAATTAIATSRDYTDSFFPIAPDATKANQTALRDTSGAIRADINNNINYGLSLKLNSTDYLNPDWNATSGKAAILNKPQITSQWSFLGNALAGNPNAFLGTTDNTDLIFKRFGYTVMRFSTVPPSGPHFVSNSIGSGANASGAISNAIGYNANATGQVTTAIGYNLNVNGNESIAIGEYCTVNGAVSTAIGSLINISGTGSFASGSENTVNGNYSVAMGGQTFTDGDYSVAMGQSLNAKAMGAVAFGRYNDTSDSPNSSPSESDRIFQIGNGNTENDIFRSNALTILRNGNTSIGSNYAPTEKLEVLGRIKAQNLRLIDIPIRADNSDASDLENGDVYRTSTGDLKIKY